MLSLRTGLPGHGKTLTTIAYVDHEYSTSGRPIYYHGIPDLTLPWFHLDDPEKWFECSEGSIILIDEAQRIFPVRSASVPVPPKCKHFETHRHKGFDIFLITQHPNLLDVHVRRLVGEHVHVFRPWGLSRVVLHRWEGVQDDPRDYNSLRNAQKQSLSFPRRYFDVYKSATIHTVKRKIPFRFFLLFILLFVVAICGYFLYRVLFVRSSGSVPVPSSLGYVGAVVSSSGTGNNSSSSSSKPVQSTEELRKQYVIQHTPLVSGVPWTAPVYDEVRKPVSYPKMVCVKLRDECRCYSQQATRLDVPSSVCVSVLDRGLFDYAKPDPGSRDLRYGQGLAVQNEERAVSPLQPISSPPASSLPVRSEPMRLSSPLTVTKVMR